MPTTLTPRDGEARPVASAGVALTDEGALRRLFDEEFQGLVAEARTRLPGYEGLAPKVVETAFVRVWKERERFGTNEQLHAFLVDEVHHGAVRTLSRRSAAARMASHGTNGGTHEPIPAPDAPVDAATAWSHVDAAIHAETRPDVAHAKAVEVSRHEAAHHMARIAKRRSWALPVIGFLGVVAICGGGIYYLDTLGADSALRRAVEDPDARAVFSNAAQKGVMELDEGTKVTIAPESHLAIPKNFGPKMRGVKLDGSATFQVASLPEADPFQLFIGPATIVVKGTTFTARHYENDTETTIVAREGTVEVTAGEQTRTLTAGQGAVVDATGALRELSGEALVESLGWASDTLAVNGRQLRAALPEMKRWFGYTIKVPDTTLLSRPVTMRVPVDSARMAIRQIEESGGLRFEWAGLNMTFVDAKPKM